MKRNNNNSSDFVRGDARRVRQIVINLLTNAVKFSPSGADIILAANIITVSMRDSVYLLLSVTQVLL